MVNLNILNDVSVRSRESEYEGDAEGEGNI
jgi:hypothetical protein